MLSCSTIISCHRVWHTLCSRVRGLDALRRALGSTDFQRPSWTTESGRFSVGCCLLMHDSPDHIDHDKTGLFTLR